MTISATVGTQNELVRFSFLTIFEPREALDKQLKYSVAVMVPNESHEIQTQLKNALLSAIEEGLDKGRFPAKLAAPYKKKLTAWKPGKPFPTTDKNDDFKVVVHDGTKDSNPDLPKPKPAEYKDHVYFSASNTSPPEIRDISNKLVLVDPDAEEGRPRYYSGWWGRVIVGWHPYNRRNNQGVTAYLQKIQLVKPDTRLDGSLSADEEWGSFDDSDKIEVASETDQDIPFPA